MKKTREKILNKSRELFNLRGVANVSIREISRSLNISHSNLIYHFRDKNALIEQLHEELFELAVQVNKDLNFKQDPLRSLFISTLKGFDTIYAYRFFMLDFNLIMRENEKLAIQIRNIENVRFNMYEETITELVKSKLMQSEEFIGEFRYLILNTRIFSDYWLSSASIYEVDLLTSNTKYIKSFLLFFYRFLTEEGKVKFKELLEEFSLDQVVA
jgi:AcrR family transcriptional regulator